MLTKKLQKNKFGLILDETTDVAPEKQLGIVVVYCDAENLNLTTQFLDLVPVCDNTANGLYGALKASLQAKNIPMNNIVGFSSDTTNVMFGPNESVVALLKKGYPDVVVAT